MCGSAYDMTVNMTGPGYSDESCDARKVCPYDYDLRVVRLRPWRSRAGLRLEYFLFNQLPEFSQLQ